MSKISVIVPVYKVEPYLRRCVDSILNQSFREFDLILVDDGSPDSCGAICDAYGAKDDRVHVIHQKNGGLSAARNSGIDWAFANSDSGWLTFIDSDDWVHRDYLKVLYEAAQAHQTGIAVCGFLQTQEQTEDAPICGGSVCLDAGSAYVDHYGMCMTACCKLYRKELFAQIRFPEGKLHEDAFVTHRLIFQAERVAVAEQGLYYYFYNPNSITRAAWKENRLDGLQAHEQRLAFFRETGREACYHKELEKTVEFVTENLRILMELYDTDRFYQIHFDMLRDTLQRYFREAVQRKVMSRNMETAWSAMFAARPQWIWKSAYTLRRLYKKIR